VSNHPRRERRSRIDIDDENAVSKCGKFRRKITSQVRFGDSTLLFGIFLLWPKRDLGEAEARIVALLDTKRPRATNIDGRRIHQAKRRPRRSAARTGASVVRPSIRSDDRIRSSEPLVHLGDFVMTIPTENVGSLPRPATLQAAIKAYDEGTITQDARKGAGRRL